MSDNVGRTDVVYVRACVCVCVFVLYLKYSLQIYQLTTKLDSNTFKKYYVRCRAAMDSRRHFDSGDLGLNSSAVIRGGSNQQQRTSGSADESTHQNRKSIAQDNSLLFGYIHVK